MTISSAAAFDEGLDFFEAVITQVPDGGWDRPSPCEGWTALDVLGHLVTSLSLGAAFLRNEQPSPPEADRPADLVGPDPLASFRVAAAACRAALAGADLDQVVDTPMGPRTIADRLAFPAIDLYVHAWDIGAAVDLDVVIPDAIVELTHTYIDPFPPEVVRGPGGAFGPEVEPPAGASTSEAFIAWTGRSR